MPWKFIITESFLNKKTSENYNSTYFQFIWTYTVTQLKKNTPLLFVSA